MPRFIIRATLFFLLGIFLNTITIAAEFQAKVIDVIDGDTIKVLRNHRTVTLRLNGIDAPEVRQAYGRESGAFVITKAFLKDVTVQTHGRDKYGRTIGDVFLPDGTMLNKELVKAGLAWWYCKYSMDQSLANLEIEAREARRGLWQHPKPVPPWVYRKRKRGQSVRRNEMLCFPRERGQHEEARPIPMPESQELATLPILGNLRSYKYHRSDCPSYHLIAPRNRVLFGSAHEAREAGYTLAGNCLD